MTNIRLTLSCGDYDRTRPIIDGKIASPGLDINVIPLPSSERHSRFVRSFEFDVCELQIAQYLGLKSRDRTANVEVLLKDLDICQVAINATNDQTPRRARTPMKTLFYMGRNKKNKSGVSWKIWKIERKGRIVTTWWGPAALIKRRVKAKGDLQCKSRKFRDVVFAKRFASARIDAKLRKGYERKPRKRG